MGIEDKKEKLNKYLDQIHEIETKIEQDLGITIESNVKLPTKRNATSKWVRLYNKMKVGDSVLLPFADARTMQSSLSQQKLGSNVTSRKVAPEKCGGKEGMVRVFKIASDAPIKDVEIEQH